MVESLVKKMKNKKEVVTPIRARASESDQKRWQKYAKYINYDSYSKWVRDTLNRVVDAHEAENDQH